MPPSRQERNRFLSLRRLLHATESARCRRGNYSERVRLSWTQIPAGCNRWNRGEYPTCQRQMSVLGRSCTSALLHRSPLRLTNISGAETEPSSPLPPNPASITSRWIQMRARSFPSLSRIVAATKRFGRPFDLDGACQRRGLSDGQVSIDTPSSGKEGEPPALHGTVVGTTATEQGGLSKQRP